MLIEHLSVSRTNVWQTCQQQYKFKYHLKTASPEPVPYYFEFGKICHKVIELYTKDRGKTDISVFMKQVLTGEVDLEPGKKALPMPAEYKRRFPQNMRNFMKLVSRIGTDGHVEWPFLYDLDPPHGRVLKGFIDRLIEKDGKYIILDYKTTQKGRFRKDSSNVTKDLQLQAYCRVIQKEFNVAAENISAGLYYLEDGELVAARFSQDTLDKVEEKLRNYYHHIAQADSNKVLGDVGQWCKRCDYRSLCPFYRLI